MTSDRRDAIADVVDEAARLTASASPTTVPTVSPPSSRVQRDSPMPVSRSSARPTCPSWRPRCAAAGADVPSALVHAVRALLVLADELERRSARRRSHARNRGAVHGDISAARAPGGRGRPCDPRDRRGLAVRPRTASSRARRWRSSDSCSVCPTFRRSRPPNANMG